MTRGNQIAIDCFIFTFFLVIGGMICGSSTIDKSARNITHEQTEYKESFIIVSSKKQTVEEQETDIEHQVQQKEKEGYKVVPISTGYRIFAVGMSR